MAVIRGLMTDDEWAYFEPLLIRRGGRPPRNYRRVLDAVFWQIGATCRRNLATGIRSFGNFDAGPTAASSTCSWRRLPEAAHVMPRCRWSTQRSSGRTSVLVAERGSRAQRAWPFARGLLDQDQRTYQRGRPAIGLVITPGQAHDVTAFPALMQEVDCDLEQLLGDKGYDSDAVRQEIADRGGEALIPTKANRKIQYTVDKAWTAQPHRALLQSLEKLTTRGNPLR